jgi:hypothetical protein
VEERDRVVGAERVDARDVVGERAAAHRQRERLLVQDVPARDLRAAIGERLRRAVGAGERHHLLAALEQAREQRLADEAAAARDEDARHRQSARLIAGRARAR